MKYSEEKNVLALLAMLKAHGIRRIVASPGGTNFPLVGSLQADPYFSLYSAVDERHAAYLACGMASESGEPVMLSCTGATASRNYLPGLTEAFYRKLPILVVTSSQDDSHLGNLFAQMTDRHHAIPDAVRYSVSCSIARTEGEMRNRAYTISEAILELYRHGGGPVHINLVSTFSSNFNVSELPRFERLFRYCVGDDWPALTGFRRIVVWIGSHERFSDRAQAILERFAIAFDAPVLCDHTSSYRGKNAIAAALVCAQNIAENPRYAALRPDLIIHVGEVSGDYLTTGYLEGLAPVWRVNPDGEFRNRLGRLAAVFESQESEFFEHYAGESAADRLAGFADAWMKADSELRSRLPDVPFSNIWIERQLNGALPPGAVLHLAINNSLRSRNFTPLEKTVHSSSTVGGFGIDGCVSSLLGASLVNPGKLYFGVFGDLAFFYDLNAIGNRHVGKNLRLLVVNNNGGAEFNNNDNWVKALDGRLNDFVAAGGHFGAQSRTLLRHFAEDLGFKYISATDKSDFEKQLEVFIRADADRPILFECFTNLADERMAFQAYQSIDPDRSLKAELKRVLPSSVKSTIRFVIGK